MGLAPVFGVEETGEVGGIGAMGYKIRVYLCFGD